MSTKFLTNTSDEKSLSKTVTALTKNSEKLDFLVGYFYFSGFCEIYKDLQDKPLRILIGMDAEVDLNNCIVEWTAILGDKKNIVSKQTIRNKYFESLKKCINTADILDSVEFEKSYRLFIQKLENGTLEVRKTKEPNHAKMYLFHIPSKSSNIGVDETKLIVGSSNFSIQGFKARNEINVYLQDDSDGKEGGKIFEELWNDAIPLVSADNIEDFKSQVIEHTWLETRPTPYQMYVRVLYEYFKISSDYIKTPKELTHDRMNQFFDVSYQIDAIRDGVAKVRKHSGCIVADVVGLGKSIIASAIAANLNRKTVIITPPHLKTQWEDYAADFGLRGCKIYTSGKLEEAANDNQGCSDLTVIIAEAHRYRNEDTEAYGYLHKLCAGNQVILLSATPFNNNPEDIFSMIKLFQIPSHSTIQTVNNLGSQMAELVKEYNQLKKDNRNQTINDVEFKKKANEIAERIRDILNPVVIRRTRIDLENLKEYQKDLQAQGILFSDVQPPKSQTYELGDLTELYKETLELLTDEDNGFKGTRYKPMVYLKNDKSILAKYAKHFEVGNFQTGQKNMADFMQQLLVRRFESSKYSFVKTLENVQRSMKNLLKWYEDLKKIPLYKKGKFPNYEEMKDLSDTYENSLFEFDDILQSFYSKDIEKGLIFVDAADITENFKKDLLEDIALFDRFLSKWNKVKSDPKLNHIEASIKSSLAKDPKRKIIIFTEFSDTADYLAEELQKVGIRSMMYSSKVASKIGREIIRSNFDAGYPTSMQKNDYDVLVATDAISEGYSLHRAGTIYNYDIPYNPTRVIQRVGRINRINKKVFDELYIYNFFPTATGEQISHTAEISTFKMKLFQAILGADTKILTEDETIDGYFGKKFTEEQNDENTLSWDVPFKNELSRIKTEEKELLEYVKNLPHRCRIARQNVNINNESIKSSGDDLFSELSGSGVLLFSKKGDAYRFCWAGHNGGTVILNPLQALNIFKATKDEQPIDVSDKFYPLYEEAKRMSGIVKSVKSKSKNVQEAIGLIEKLLRVIKNENESKYLKAVREVISLDSLPMYYLKELTKMSYSNPDIIKQIQSILPENYIETLLEKDSRVGSEPETILLAEEIL